MTDQDTLAASPELQGLYKQMSDALLQVEEILAPFIPVARHADALLNVEGEKAEAEQGANFIVFHNATTGETVDVLRRVTSQLRAFYPGAPLP